MNHTILSLSLFIFVILVYTFGFNTSYSVAQFCIWFFSAWESSILIERLINNDISLFLSL